MEYILKNKKKPPTPPPPYVPPQLLTAEEIEIKRNKADEDFIKTSMQISKGGLDAAANEFSDQKNKKNN